MKDQKQTERLRRFFVKYFPLSLRDVLIFLGTMLLTALLCLVLQPLSVTDVHVPMIFVLAVLLISLSTSGYLFGFLASLLGVLGVNWAFTYPYYEVNFSITGYPLTFMTMLAVGFAVSTLTSRLKEQEQARIESEKEKLRANLLRAVSHDLRTPLTSIGGAISTVLDSPGISLDEQSRQLLLDARDDAEWLQRMVENLLSVTRFSDDPVSQIRKENELLEEVLGEVAAKFKKTRPDIALSVSVPGEPLFVPMDATLVEQLLLNLLYNAAQHGEKTRRIELRAEEEAGFARISVTDDGCGFEENQRRQLFSSPAPVNGRADSSRSMGIGLMVCRSIAEAHGGSIRAENLPDGGARVSFTLPLRR